MKARTVIDLLLAGSIFKAVRGMEKSNMAAGVSRLAFALGLCFLLSLASCGSSSSPLTAPSPGQGGALSVSPVGGLSASGAQGGPFSPTSLTYTLTNTGGASISWTASKTQDWIVLSSSSGSLAAGETATVTASIGSGANSLAAGSYSDTVTFTNTTNGNGNASRSASLTVNATTGATLTVTDMGDSGAPGQLRTLMNAAAPGDTIIIPAGTITLTGPSAEDLNAGGDLDILKNLTIRGAGAGTTIIDGGGIDGVFDIQAPHHLTLSGVTIRNGINSSQAGGGGIRNFGTLSLSNAIVSGNQAARTTAGIRNDGGGIRNLGAMTLTNVSITGNLARGNGGGIYNELGSVMTLTDVTVSANTAEIGGGGIFNFGSATLTNVTVNGNTADIQGGGIFTGGVVVTAAAATLTNVTVTGNHVTGSGGGIFNSATAILTNVTVSGNTADFSGGGIANFGSATLMNVIFSGNTGAAVPSSGNCSGSITSLGHNLESGAGCGVAGPGDLSNTDPTLGPLQNNGGFTFTQALLPGSPAINAGANAGCPSTDQRGIARPQGASCDIGAYEAP